MTKNEYSSFGVACPDCGKVRFDSRSGAKSAIRRMRGRGQAAAKHGAGHLNAYPCGEFWHIGHLPAPVLTGDLARDEIGRRPAS